MDSEKKDEGSVSGRRGKKSAVIAAVSVLAVIASVFVMLGSRNGDAGSSVVADEGGTKAAVTAKASNEPDSSEAIPRLLDLGANKCIPCKKMAPILEEMKKDFSGKFDVVFIDVWQNRDEAGRYNVRLIPTQIYFDKSGKELTRHEGFASREDILKTWEGLGYKFGGK
jgi:thioredoxin 1